MTDKYYIGMTEVPYAEYQEKKEQELAAGHGIEKTAEVDGRPEYTLKDGTVIQGNGEGGFNRVADGQVEEAWRAGTVNEWIQGEPTMDGSLEFFCKA